MTLPSSGNMAVTAINVENTRPSTSSFSMDELGNRNLAGVPSGSYSFSNFYGKTYGGGGGGGSVTVGTTGSDITSGGVATITGLSFGTAVAARRIFVCAEWSCDTSAVATTISSATIGGIAASIHVHTGQGGTSTLSNYGCGIISATVAAGTTGTVAITFSNATVRTARATTYRVTGLVSATATDIASGFDETAGAGSASAQSTCSVPSNGLLFVAGIVSAAVSVGGLTFTGATERVEAAGSLDERYGNAMSFGLGASNRAVGVQAAVGNTGRARMVAASFQLS